MAAKKAVLSRGAHDHVYKVVESLTSRGLSEGNGIIPIEHALVRLCLWPVRNLMACRCHQGCQDKQVFGWGNICRMDHRVHL